MMKTKSFLRDPYWQITALFVLIKLGLHLFTFDHYELHRDEMLFFNQGDHISFGNATVPPFIGWVAFIIKNVFGYSVFGIRLFPMLLGAASVILIAKIVKELRGKQMALVLSASAFVFSPGFLLFDSLFTVNVFDQFFWLIIAYLFIRMVNTGNPKLWIWIGVAGGFAFLNKYLVLYLLAGFFIALLISPYRKLIFNKYLILAMIAGLVIISPNIYWQYAHGWPLFFHISELRKTQMVNMTYRNFMIDLFDLNYVSTFFWLSGLILVLFAKSETRHRYIGLAAIFVISLFIISRGKAYYALGLFPVLFALSGCMLEKYLTKRFHYLNHAVVGIIFLFSVMAMPFALPVLSFEQLGNYSRKTAGLVSYPFSRWEDGKVHPVSQVFSDMTGWQDLVALVNEAWLQVPEYERSKTTIYAERNYGYAGAIYFYGRQYNLPDAITFLESYVLWAPDTIPAGPVIYINYEIGGLNNLFEKYTETGRVNDSYFRENGLKVFLCEDPNERMREIYKQKAATEKNNYRRRKKRW